MFQTLDFSVSTSKPREQGLYLLFNGQKVFCQTGSTTPKLLTHEQTLQLGPDISSHFFCSFKGSPYFAIDVKPESLASPQQEWVEMREILRDSSETTIAITVRGKQILDFLRTHQFCGRCGAATLEHKSDLARHCPDCNESYYPRLSPCMIVLVIRGDELLLAHGHRQPEGMYSTLAGFIEPGENIEQAVHREVYEEVGIKIDNLEYFGSQPWPFPHQLMIGFHAEYHSGKITIDNDEIIDAQWWHYKNLPKIPPTLSIAGQLIETCVNRLEGST